MAVKMRFKDRVLLALAPPLAAGLIRLIGRLTRFDYVGTEHVESIWKTGKYVILSFWHDQLLLMVQGYKGPGAKILISASKDGELIARTIQKFGQGTVRGSSSRGGRAAFRSLVALGEEQVDLVITPDGPKGPRHELKDGLIQLARLTGRPVVPMAFVCSRGKRFSSWDKFLLPLPFGQGVFSFGEPVYFDKSEGVDVFRDRIQKAMTVNQQKAIARLEAKGATAV